MALKLGSTRIAMLGGDLDRTRDQRQLSLQVCRVVPKARIKSRKGTIEGLELGSLLPQDGQPSKVGDRGDAHVSPTIPNSRTYRCERFAEARDMDSELDGDELADDVKSALMPAIENQISFDIDQMLLEIASGSGTAGNSRNSTNITLAAGAEWDNNASATSLPIDALEAGVDLTAADLGFFDTSTARALCRNDQLKSLVMTNSKAVLPLEEMVETLMRHLGLMKIVIGRRIFNANGPHQLMSLDYKFKGTAMVSKMSNLLYLPYRARRWKEFEKESQEVNYVMGSEWADIIVQDPKLTVHYTNVLQ